MLCYAVMRSILFARKIANQSHAVVWVKQDGIFVPTAACWAQGWFMQVGKLVCSGMLVLISKEIFHLAKSLLLVV